MPSRGTGSLRSSAARAFVRASTVKPRAIPVEEAHQGIPIETLRWLKTRAATLRRRAETVIEEARQEAERLTDEAKRLEETAREIERGRGLPGSDKVRTISEMDALRTQSTKAIGRAGRPIQSDHPFPAALAARGVRLVDWAEKHSVSPEQARSWYATSPSQRRKIPAKYARAIEKEFGLRADTSTWPQGIKP